MLPYLTAIRGAICYGITQVNPSRLNPDQTGRYSIYLPRRMEGWVEL